MTCPTILPAQVSHPIPAASLSPALRRCWPVRSSGCWPKLSRVDKASCSMCCDPRFTRGDPTCFLGRRLKRNGARDGRIEVLGFRITWQVSGRNQT